MMTLIYGFCLFLTVVVLIYMAQRNYHNIDIYHWTILLLIPIVIMSYWLKTQAISPQAASALICFSYLDSTFLYGALFFYIMHNIGIKAGPGLKIAVYGLATIQMMIVCLCFNTDLYYGSLRVVSTNIGNAVKVTSGPLGITHIIYLAIMMCLFIWALIAGIMRRGSYAIDDLVIYITLPFTAMALYLVEIKTNADFTLLPVVYAAAEVIIALRYDGAHTHDIAFLIADHNNRDKERGYVAVGPNLTLLSCNQRSYDLIPFLKDQNVNEKIPEKDEIGKVITGLIKGFERGGASTARYSLDDRTYECEVSYFSIREDKRRQGYLLNIHDATEEQRAYDIISSYNDRLNTEVREKTENIRDMQRKIVLGMADMIENRDNNTGGHVKRTSDIIRIIVDEIVRQGNIKISEQMAEDIVRAAPTHDLGKVTIDNSILNKPGRFTDEEYAIMKTHSAKSGDLVKILLDGVEEDHFVSVAYNVARYHHERWDGRGYPEGLVGSMIPLEARIMAVSDVYDALVSKRVYKEAMDFEKSASIMCECMGTQFDPNLKSVFLGCREKLEEYYMHNN